MRSVLQNRFAIVFHLFFKQIIDLQKRAANEYHYGLDIETPQRFLHDPEYPDGRAIGMQKYF